MNTFEEVANAFMFNRPPIADITRKLSERYPKSFPVEAFHDAVLAKPTDEEKTREFCRLWKMRDAKTILYIHQIAGDLDATQLQLLIESTLLELFKKKLKKNPSAYEKGVFAEKARFLKAFAEYLDENEETQAEHDGGLTKQSLVDALSQAGCLDILRQAQLDQESTTCNNTVVGGSASSSTQHALQEQFRRVNKSISTNLPLLIGLLDLETGEVGPELVAKGILTLADRTALLEEKKSAKRNETFILNYLVRSPLKWNDFINILRDNGNATLATALQEAFDA